MPLTVLALTFILGKRESGIIAPGATLERLATGFSFTEGPSADKEGNVYFTDQPNDRIMKWGLDGKVIEWMKPCGRSNGTAFDRKGNLIACADDKNELWSISPKKQVKVLLKDFGGKLLNGPNDVWIRPDGGLYLTDPMYARPYWTRSSKSEQSGQHVYFLSADRKKFVQETDDLRAPNGIVGTPNGKYLYVSDIGAGKTYRYQIGVDGTLTAKTLYCSLGSDGMTTDNRGDVYLTGQGVTVFDPTGKQIEHIDVPEGWTGNIKFGGRGHDMLFITASKSIYGLKMKVHGVQ